MIGCVLGAFVAAGSALLFLNQDATFSRQLWVEAARAGDSSRLRSLAGRLVRSQVLLGHDDLAALEALLGHDRIDLDPRGDEVWVDLGPIGLGWCYLIVRTRDGRIVDSSVELVPIS